MTKPKMYAIVFLFPVLLFGIYAFDYPNETSLYIDKYSSYAIQEMHKSGIPASITIAQAIIESSWGKGDLAVKSKNFFGIKCKKSWAGGKVYHEDDDYVDGKLIKSCFRAYDDVKDSFADHTFFLQENARYASLFDLEKTDYVSWAKGLKSCGYATDPSYADKLIKMIDKYQLYKYDLIDETEPVIVMAPIQGLSLPRTQTTPQASTAIYSDVVAMPYPAPAVFEIPSNYERNSGETIFQDHELYAAHNDPDPIVEEPLVIQSTPTATSYSLGPTIVKEEVVVPQEIVPIPTTTLPVVPEKRETMVAVPSTEKKEAITVYDQKAQDGNILLGRKPRSTSKRRY